MPPYDLKERTMEFAVAVYRLCRNLPGTDESRHIAGQLRRAASSVAANYRGACRGRSDRELISKLGTCVEEGDESGFWLDFLARIELLTPAIVKPLTGEANELVAIFTAGRKTGSRLKQVRASLSFLSSFLTARGAPPPRAAARLADARAPRPQALFILLPSTFQGSS